MFTSIIDLSVIEKILRQARTIAVVGLSPKSSRPSHQVAQYLLAAGYDIIPVNPGQSEILGLRCYPDLAAVPVRVDVVDIFRQADEVPPIVAQAIKIKAGTVWMQLGIVNEEAARQASAAGLMVIMDRCLKIEHQNLLGAAALKPFSPRF